MMKWNNKGEGKQLTPKQRLQRQKLIVYPIFAVIFIFVMYFIFVPSATKKDNIEEVNGYNVNIPVSKGDNITNDKKAAYEAEDIRQKQNERKTLEDYAFELTSREEESKSLSLLPEKENQATGVVTSVTTYKDLTKEMQSFYQPINKEDREKENLQRQIEQLQQQLQGIQTQPNQQELMEESYKLAAKYLNVQAAETAIPTSPVTLVNEENKRDVNPVCGVSDGVVSRLGAANLNRVVSQLGNTNPNSRFYSLSSVEKSTCTLIKACVYSDLVLFFGENTGVQKVSLRLLEAMQVGSIIIPRNTLLTGIARLRDKRLTVTVDNLIYDNKIISISLKVFDMDGLEGINVPGSQELNSTKETASALTGNLGTSINLNGSAGQQLASDLARGVIQNAASYLGKKIKTVKITLTGNYMVYLTNRM